LNQRRQEQEINLPLLAGPQCPFGMVFVFAASVGVHKKRKLSSKLVAILLRHEWHNKLVVVHRNKNTPFACMNSARERMGKMWEGEREGGRRGAPAGNGPPSSVSFNGWSVIMHKRPLS
jgi:hypothetical protein